MLGRLARRHGDDSSTWTMQVHLNEIVIVKSDTLEVRPGLWEHWRDNGGLRGWWGRTFAEGWAAGWGRSLWTRASSAVVGAVYQIGSGYAGLGHWGFRAKAMPALAEESKTLAEDRAYKSAEQAGKVTEHAVVAAVVVIGLSMVIDFWGPGSEAALVDDIAETATKQADALAAQADTLVAQADALASQTDEVAEAGAEAAARATDNAAGGLVSDPAEVLERYRHRTGPKWEKPNNHHPIPMAVGGMEDLPPGMYYPVETRYHKAFHSIFNRELKARGLVPKRGGINASQEQWQVHFAENPGTQQEVYAAALDAARVVDQEFGTTFAPTLQRNIDAGLYYDY